MQKFDFKIFRANPHLKLVAEHYQKDEFRPIAEYETVMDERLAIKDPYTNRLVLIYDGAETHDDDGNWISTVYMVENIYTSGSLAEMLLTSKTEEDFHLITSKTTAGYSIRRLSVFGADIFIARHWNCDVYVYDATGKRLDVRDIDIWICDFTGLNPDENIYQVDEETHIRANHEYFDRAYLLNNLRCDEEGWFISDTGSHYRVEANDDRSEVCPNNGVALHRAKARGIRFREDNPYCPSELIYPHHKIIYNEKNL